MKTRQAIRGCSTIPSSVPTVVSKGKRNFSDTLEKEKTVCSPFQFEGRVDMYGETSLGIIVRTLYESVICNAHQVWKHFLVYMCIIK